MASRKQNKLATSAANRRLALDKNLKGQIENGLHNNPNQPLLGKPKAGCRHDEAQPSSVQIVLFWSCVLSGFVWLLLVAHF
tara:strand:+ start:1013 stop:1255 length:243 start_codon:yes stop_codon:yes gene_type:complete